jgi:hypothetical protein
MPGAAANAGGAGVGNFSPQNLHFMAICKMVSAQYGHFFVGSFALISPLWGVVAPQPGQNFKFVS